MASFGVLPSGFVRKLFQDIKSEIEQEQIDTISGGLNHSTASVLTRINAPVADHMAELWELANAVYNGLDPAAASGQALDALAAITGVTRLDATFSTVDLEFTATAAIVVPAGTIVSATGQPDVRFATDAPLNFGGPGVQTVSATATVTGPIDAGVNTLTVLENPISQISGVTNLAKPNLGRNLETDTELRQRRAEVLATPGGSTVAAIRAALQQVDGVSEAVVFENVTDFTDAAGVPPHAIEAVVEGGLDDAIAQAIFDKNPAGTETHTGTGDMGTAIDSEGAGRMIKFSRPAFTQIYVTINVTVSPEYAGNLAVQEAVRDYVLGLGFGDDVITSQLCVPVFGVGGVTDIVSTFIGTAPAPVSSANIPIAPREQAIIDNHLVDVVVNLV